MKLGRYYLVANQKHRRGIQKVSSERERELKRSISDLGRIMGSNFPWILTGSLASALNVGKFYRDCNDADIIFSKEDLCSLIDSTKIRQYQLCHRLASLKISPEKNLYIYQEVDSNRTLNQNCKHLKLIRRNSLGYLEDGEGILDSIDLFPYEKIGGGNVRVDGNVVFPYERFFVQTETLCGQKILIASPEYLMKFKEQQLAKGKGGNSAKHSLDFEVLKEFVARKN